MAVQSGVLFFDGRPADDECESLAASLEPLALDGVSTLARAGIAMAFGACHVWAGEEDCTQPLQTAGGLMVTWDGRLDNRDDLLLQLRGRMEAASCDAAIAMAVFDRWGMDGLRSLIGDWSMAIWNTRTRVLHLARDYMGVRPLYYCVGDDAVMWSTSLGDLAVRSRRVDDLDESFAARFMTLRFSTDVTPYRGIRAVPSGTCASFSPEGDESRHLFWRLEPGTVRYRDHRQYEEHLRALWSEAVGSRLRTRGMVWAELSGGLDSSSVVCMADALIRDERVPARDLYSVCHVTLESPEGDERPFVAEVDRRTGRPSDILGVEAHAGESVREWDWVTPLAPRGVKARSIRHVREAGGRVLLTGRVGDAAMGGAPDNCVAVFDDLARWRARAALSNMLHWSRAGRRPFVEVAWALFREWMGAGLSEDGEPVGVGVLTPSLTARTFAHEIASDIAGPVRLAQRRHARSVLFYAQEARLETWVGSGCVTVTHPFAHRPLVEFMLAVPSEEQATPADTRSLMRRAFAGLVPERILRRTSKGHYAPVALRAARATSLDIPPVEQLECVQRGWIDPQRLSVAIRRLTSGCGHSLLDVQRVLRLERWLASRARRGPADIPIRKEVNTNDVRIA